MAFEISTMKKRKPPGFMTLLSSVACEWLLIFLLFMDAAFSDLLTRFAHYCELKTPCPICSRLDKKKPGSYWSLLCSNHREEVSSLVSCSTHGILADVHDMCEECLLPIATQNKSNSESYRLLVGKMWVDVEESVFQHLLVNKYIRFDFSGRTCLCCNQTWRNKSNAKRLLLEVTPVGLGASKANMKPPLPRVPGRSRFSRRDSLKRLRDKLTTHPSSGVHALSHVGYTKLKVTSDSESEVPLSEDDDNDDYRVRNRASKVKPLIIDRPNLLDLSENKNDDSSTLDSVKEHGLEELNWMDSYHEPNPSLTTELISLDEAVQTPDVSLPYMSTISVLSELLSLYNGPSLSNTVEIPETIINIEGATEKESVLEVEHIEAASTSKHKRMKLTDSSSQSSENTKLLVILEVEPINVSDSAKIEENLNSPPLIEVCVSPKHTSGPKANTENDESRKDEDSISQSVPVSAPMARSSSYESLDEDKVKDIEGESIVDRLKRQIDHDRTCMDSLYKELEEERSASSVAANEAMAMITRLQEEKAALHMEALQYLRMMEEQAEYDMEALERANDLLAEKEKELQDLEIELELYRNNFIDGSGEHDVPKEPFVVNNHAENGPGSLSNFKSTEISKANGNCTPMNNSASNFEDEKFYIRQCLKKLEEKLHEANFRSKIDEKQNGINSENEEISPLPEKVIPDSNGNHAEDIASNGSTLHDKENDCLYEKCDKGSASRGEISLAIENEIAQLHDRLAALETDQDFLNHASDLFRNGEDGLNFIQGIAHQLQELRKIEFKNR